MSTDPSIALAGERSSPSKPARWGPRHARRCRCATPGDGSSGSSRSSRCRSNSRRDLAAALPIIALYAGAALLLGLVASVLLARRLKRADLSVWSSRIWPSCCASARRPSRHPRGRDRRPISTAPCRSSTPRRAACSTFPPTSPGAASYELHHGRSTSCSAATCRPRTIVFVQRRAGAARQPHARSAATAAISGPSSPCATGPSWSARPRARQRPRVDRRHARPVARVRQPAYTLSGCCS